MDMAGRSSWAKGLQGGGAGGRDLDKDLKQNSQNRYKRQNEINQRPDDEGINNNLVKLENR